MSTKRPASAQTAEWNILVFLNAKNNLEPFAFPNFEQMAAVGSTDKVNILVEFGRPIRHYTRSDHPYGNWSKTLRFRVKKGMTPIVSNAVQDLGKVNMGGGAALADFVRWAAAHYPAKRTLLTIWDHGQGWRAPLATRFRGTGEDVDRFLQTRDEDHAEGDPRAPFGVPRGEIVPGTVRYVSHDEDTNDKLYNREIQDVLTKLLAGKKLDVLGFDACLMSMLETAYAFRNVAHTLVGSEELEPGSGWNYQRWLEPLVRAPEGVDAAALGKLMVRAYGEQYSEDGEDATLSAVDLARADDLAGRVSKLANAARAALGSQLAAIKAARYACANYAPGYPLNSIDLSRFAEQLAAQPGIGGSLLEAAEGVRRGVAESVLANYASESRQGKFGSKGLAVYFPKTKFRYDADPDAQAYTPANASYPVEFVQKQTWAQFLHAYLEAVPY